MEPEGLLPYSQEPIPTLSQNNVDHFFRTYFSRSRIILFFHGSMPGRVKYFSRAFIPTVGPTHAHSPSYSLVPGVKRPWNEADHWSQSSTETGTSVPIYPLLHMTSLLAQERLQLLPFIGELMVWTGVTGKNVVPRQEYNSGHLVIC